MLVAHRGLAPVGVPVELDRVALVLAEVEAGEERGVEERRGELAHAAAHLLGVLAVGDRAGGHEPLGDGALADVVVDRERLARRDDGAPHEVGHPVDVGDPGLSTLVVRRVGADDLLHAEPACPLTSLSGGLGACRERDGGLAGEQRCDDGLGGVLGAAHRCVLAADGHRHATLDVESHAGRIGLGRHVLREDLRDRLRAAWSAAVWSRRWPGRPRAGTPTRRPCCSLRRSRG